MLSEVSVVKVFMHYFQNMLSASAGFTSHPTGATPLDPAGRLSSPKSPNLPTHGKNHTSAHGHSLTARSTRTEMSLAYAPR